MVNIPSDFVRPRPITLGLVYCLQVILQLVEVICGKCLNTINNVSACSVLF